MCLRTGLIFVAFGLLFVPHASGESSLLRQLIEEGVPFSAGDHVKLPEPTLPDGLDARAQRKQLEEAAKGRFSWEDLTRKSVVAPFLLKIESAQPGKSEGCRVDLWFVLYAKLDAARVDDFFSLQLKSGDTEGEPAPTVHLLSTEELAKRGIKTPGGSPKIRYVAAESTPLDRVSVNVTTRNEQQETADSILVASLMDPRFDEDPQFPNRWRAITRDGGGRRALGPAQSYRGLGSYLKTTRLVEPQGALLVEYHLAFSEPKEWFNGANLLRSKLPIVAQNAVRSLRRNVDRKP